MSVQSSSTIGSGTLPFTTQILPPTGRGQVSGARGDRWGTNVVVINPEDQIAVDAFAVSGVSFGVTPVKIWDANINPLPRQRMITLVNIGPGDAFIGQSSTAVIAPSGFVIPAPAAATESLSRLDLPFMRNVEIWARSTSTSQIRIIAY